MCDNMIDRILRKYKNFAPMIADEYSSWGGRRSSRVGLCWKTRPCSPRCIGPRRPDYSPPSSVVGSSPQPPVVTTSSVGMAPSLNVTTATFTPMNSGGSQRRSRHGRTRTIPSRNNTYNALFGPATWAKYFDLHHLDSTAPDDFSLHKNLVDSVDASVTLKSTSYGTRVVAAPSKDAGTRLAALSCIGESRVRVSTNARLNASVGSVLLPHHVATSVRDLNDWHEGIKHILEAQGHSVLQVDTFTRPPPPPVVVAVSPFELRKSPLIVGPFRPLLLLLVADAQFRSTFPLLDYAISVASSGMVSCNAPVLCICALCVGTIVIVSRWTSLQTRCLNCGEAHPTFWRACMDYKLEEAVLNLKHRDRDLFLKRDAKFVVSPLSRASPTLACCSTSPRPSRLSQSHNRFQALNQTTPTTTSPIPLPPVPDGLPLCSSSWISLLPTESAISPLSSSPSPPTVSSRAFPQSLDPPRHLSVQADIHHPPSNLRVVHSRCSSRGETIESVARYVVSGTPVSLRQKRKPGSSPSSPAGKVVSLCSSPPSLCHYIPSHFSSRTSVSDMEVSSSPDSLCCCPSRDALPDFCPPPPPTVLACPLSVVPPPPPPPDPVSPPCHLGPPIKASSSLPPRLVP
ncbi:uncharacterized protein [Procambarus clarkii]|uniref:uncharacterized protein n=1 Tax=Procambarus clarkii TaxID=6728 RepID=UPI003742F712